MSTLANVAAVGRGTHHWTNSSVLAMAQGSDPVHAIVAKTRALVFKAIESGWSGPPYDPFTLADLWEIEVTPSKDVIDARTLAASGGNLHIEFNPNRPTSRINYSVAHELGHSLFPDCAAIVRHRLEHSGATRDEWQLEMLCNIAAAEILMPIGTLHRDDLEPSIDRLLELRKQYAVSSEAVLHRLLRLTTKVCFAFVARKEPDSPNGRYKVDYAVSSRNWNAPVGNGFVLPPGTILSDCTAIGFTAKADESWFEAGSEWKIEALGIPAYPGRLYPRVIGIVRRPDGREGADTTITYLRGDATAPRGSDYRILAQIVNDRGIVWGAGFGRAVRKKWPAVQDQFAKWAVSARADFCLGNMHFCRVDDSLVVANLVAQHGFGPSRTPRIRYGALEACLQKLAGHAASKGASVHMPRIGTGEAGGSWDIVSEIIEETLCQRGIDVMVYDLPTPLGPQVAKQSYLSFHRAH